MVYRDLSCLPLIAAVFAAAGEPVDQRGFGDVFERDVLVVAAADSLNRAHAINRSQERALVRDGIFFANESMRCEARLRAFNRHFDQV